MYLGLPFFVGVVLSMMAVGLLGVVIERLVFKQIYQAPELNDILVSLGLLVFLESLAQLLFGSETLKVNTPIRDHHSCISAICTLQRVIVLVASLILIQALYLFLKFTKTGRSIVRPPRTREGHPLWDRYSQVYMLTFAISAALAAAAGALLSPVFYVYRPWQHAPAHRLRGRGLRRNGECPGRGGRWIRDRYRGELRWCLYLLRLQELLSLYHTHRHSPHTTAGLFGKKIIMKISQSSSPLSFPGSTCTFSAFCRGCLFPAFGQCGLYLCHRHIWFQHHHRHHGTAQSRPCRVIGIGAYTSAIWPPKLASLSGSPCP